MTACNPDYHRSLTNEEHEALTSNTEKLTIEVEVVLAFVGDPHYQDIIAEDVACEARRAMEQKAGTCLHDGCDLPMVEGRTACVGHLPGRPPAAAGDGRPETT